MRNLIVVAILFFLIFSCKKPENRKCWKFAGDKTELIHYTGSFGQLYLTEHISYVLVQDSVEYLKVIGGENMVNLVHFNVSDDKLSIENKNKCGFLRKYSKSKITVEIHFKNLYNIDYRGSEPLTNKDTLKIDYLTLLVMDGSSSANLTVNSLIVRGVVAHGFGDFTLSGKTNYLELDVRSNGYCDTRNLIVKDSVTAVSRTVVDIKLNANNCKLKAETEMAGNIYYTGLPTAIKILKYGTGNVYPY